MHIFEWKLRSEIETSHLSGTSMPLNKCLFCYVFSYILNVCIFISSISSVPDLLFHEVCQYFKYCLNLAIFHIYIFTFFIFRRCKSCFVAHFFVLVVIMLLCNDLKPLARFAFLLRRSDDLSLTACRLPEHRSTTPLLSRQSSWLQIIVVTLATA